jgi:hypothetical protein
MVDMFRALEYPVGYVDPSPSNRFARLSMVVTPGTEEDHYNIDYRNMKIRLNFNDKGDGVYGSIFCVNGVAYLFNYKGDLQKSIWKAFDLADELSVYL